MLTTTYGVGEMIQDAISRGIRNFIIGIGGSATNDGGTGMLSALGYEFLDADGQPVGFGGQCLEKIASISDKNKLDQLNECHFQIACDVENPLCGPTGATYIYGPQKGADDTLLPILDAGMENYGRIAEAFTGKQTMQASGAGAAGGLGFAFVTFLNGELKSGIDLILDAVGLEKSLENADYVITGEGRLDRQTAMGKGPAGVAKLGKKYGAMAISQLPLPVKTMEPPPVSKTSKCRTGCKVNMANKECVISCSIVSAAPRRIIKNTRTAAKNPAPIAKYIRLCQFN